MSSASFLRASSKSASLQYVWGSAAVAPATVAAHTLFGRQRPEDAVMLYLLAAVLVSMRATFWPSMVTVALSVLAFDLFFIPPYLSLAVSDLHHIGTFAIMFLVATIINDQTRRLHTQAELASQREQRMSSLYEMSRDLARTSEATAVAATAAGHLLRVVPGALTIERRTGTETEVLHRSGTAVAGAREQRFELESTRGTVGSLSIAADDPAALDAPGQRPLLEACAALLTGALERSRLDAESQAARTDMLREQLRSTLLSSVSHDLRTPLATVIGAASALLTGSRLSEADRNELLHSILEEAERLERLVRNLLAMTRLEAGPVALRRELQPLDGIVGVVLNRLENRLRGREVRIELPSELPPVDADELLVDQLLTNLLENALAYAPPGSPIEIAARTDGRMVTVEVADRGPGVPAEHRGRIFDKFHRVARGRGTGGVGLGLAICRAIVEAHGGHIRVDDEPGGGARFVFTLPAGAPPPSGEVAS